MNFAVCDANTLHRLIKLLPNDYRSFPSITRVPSIVREYAPPSCGCTKDVVSIKQACKFAYNEIIDGETRTPVIKPEGNSSVENYLKPSHVLYYENTNGVKKILFPCAETLDGETVIYHYVDRNEDSVELCVYNNEYIKIKRASFSFSIHNLAFTAGFYEILDELNNSRVDIKIPQENFVKLLSVAQKHSNIILSKYIAEIARICITNENFVENGIKEIKETLKEEPLLIDLSDPELVATRGSMYEIKMNPIPFSYEGTILRFKPSSTSAYKTFMCVGEYISDIGRGVDVNTRIIYVPLDCSTISGDRKGLELWCDNNSEMDNRDAFRVKRNWFDEPTVLEFYTKNVNKYTSSSLFTIFRKILEGFGFGLRSSVNELAKSNRFSMCNIPVKSIIDSELLELICSLDQGSFEYDEYGSISNVITPSRFYEVNVCVREDSNKTLLFELFKNNTPEFIRINLEPINGVFDYIYAGHAEKDMGTSKPVQQLLYVDAENRKLIVSVYENFYITVSPENTLEVPDKILNCEVILGNRCVFNEYAKDATCDYTLSKDIYDQLMHNKQAHTVVQTTEVHRLIQEKVDSSAVESTVRASMGGVSNVYTKIHEGLGRALELEVVETTALEKEGDNIIKPGTIARITGRFEKPSTSEERDKILNGSPAEFIIIRATSTDPIQYFKYKCKRYISHGDGPHPYYMNSAGTGLFVKGESASASSFSILIDKYTKPFEYTSDIELSVKFTNRFEPNNSTTIDDRTELIPKYSYDEIINAEIQHYQTGSILDPRLRIDSSPYLLLNISEGTSNGSNIEWDCNVKTEIECIFPGIYFIVTTEDDEIIPFVYASYEDNCEYCERVLNLVSNHQTAAFFTLYFNNVLDNYPSKVWIKKYNVERFHIKTIRAELNMLYDRALNDDQNARLLMNVLQPQAKQFYNINRCLNYYPYEYSDAYTSFEYDLTDSSICTYDSVSKTYTVIKNDNNNIFEMHGVLRIYYSDGSYASRMLCCKMLQRTDHVEYSYLTEQVVNKLIIVKHYAAENKFVIDTSQFTTFSPIESVEFERNFEYSYRLHRILNGYGASIQGLIEQVQALTAEVSSLKAQLSGNT